MSDWTTIDPGAVPTERLQYLYQRIKEEMGELAGKDPLEGADSARWIHLAHAKGIIGDELWKRIEARRIAESN